jgi:hypothetical protein
LLDKETLREIERTRGSISISRRVNDLLKLGLEAERRRDLDCEAEAFFHTRKIVPRVARSASLLSNLFRERDSRSPV